MATVRLGSQFFKKERDTLYSEWKTAFWREMLQNSIDAGSSRIDIEILSLEIGNQVGARVIFKDNGCGMTRKVLEDVFFALGETTKTGTDTVGGFGRARILTCFAMDGYAIHTKNLIVEGNGAEYEIKDAPTSFSGCSFQVDTLDAGKFEMLTKLENVLYRSQIACDVYVNGVKWTKWMYRRSVARTLDCGSIHVNKSQPTLGYIHVRVNGLWMFDIWHSYEHQVLVEVDVSKSRMVLSAARDSFHHKYQKDIEQWVAQLTVDKRSALREIRRKTKLIRGRGPLKLTLAGAPSQQTGGKSWAMSNAELLQKPASTEKVIVSQSYAVAQLSGIGTGGHESVKGTLDLDSVYIEDDTDNPKIRRVIDNYDPTNWVDSVKNVRGEVQEYRKGANYRKLLTVWKVACEHALRALMSYNGLTEISWLVGWAFNDDAGAMHVKSEGSHALCLNPVNSDGKMRYSFKKRGDLLAILALAKHEAAHVSVDVHNESFSTVHTEIDKRFDTTVVLRAIKEALSVG